jgi:hypothetical protein
VCSFSIVCSGTTAAIPVPCNRTESTLGVSARDEIGICGLPPTNRLNRSHVLIARRERSSRAACVRGRISFDAHLRTSFFFLSLSRVDCRCHHECDPARSFTLYEPGYWRRRRQCYTSVASRLRMVEFVGRRLRAAFPFPSSWAFPSRRCKPVISAAASHCFDNARISSRLVSWEFFHRNEISERAGPPHQRHTYIMIINRRHRHL